MRFFLLFFLLAFYACQHTETSKCSHMLNNTASHFRILNNHDSTLTIKVINPFQGSTNDTFTYLLSPHKSIPNAIHIPVKKIVLFSTTYIGFLDALNELHAVTGISGTKQVFNEQLIKKINQGQIFEVGYENSINFEKLASTKPDVVFIYSIGKETMPYVKKIESLGIPVVFVAEFMEDSPLSRAEWIKFFAAFFKKSKIADSLYQTIEKKYDSIKQLAQSIQIHPLVLLNLPYQGIWYMPEGDSYMATLIKDAGGQYLYHTTTGNKILRYSFEKVFTDAKNADIWLNTGLLKSKKELIQNDERYAQFKPYKNNCIYNHTLRSNTMGGNDFWEKGVIEPQKILDDLYHIFINDSNFTYYFYQRLK